MVVATFPLCLLLLTASSFALYSGDSYVTQLTSENFDGFISQPGISVVKFYASWCGHCENFAPKFKNAAKLLQGVVHFGAVDNEKHSNIGDRFTIEGYPTILVFPGDAAQRMEYSGARTVEDLVNFLMKQVHEVISVRAKKYGVKLSLPTEKPPTCGGSSQSSGKHDSGSQSGGKHQKQGDDHYGSESVVSLTDKNFDATVLQSDDDWLVAFIAPWCGHCQRLAPEWKKAAEQLRGKVKVGTVDATVHTNLASRYNVGGFPTIKYFKHGQPEDYHGGRSADDLVAFGLGKAELNRPPPKLEELVSNQVLNEACANKQLCVIGFLPELLDCQSECRSGYLEVLNEAAKNNKGKDWGWLWSVARVHKDLEDILQVGGFGYPTMVVINMRKEKFAVLRGSFARDGIREFLHDLSQSRSSVPLNSMAALPEIKPSTPWDGKDAPVATEEEIDLSELGIKVEL